MGGDDKLYGLGGDDMLDGGAGKDKLYGGEGDDTMYGGAGDDKFYGGEGNDTMLGGEGKDNFYIEDLDFTNVTINGQGANEAGGADTAGSWTDTITIKDVADGGPGSNWTLEKSDGAGGWTAMVEGEDYSTKGSNLTFENSDMEGRITFDEGSTINFDDIDKIDW